MGSSKPLILQDKHSEDIVAATESFLKSAGLQPDLSAAPNQPFRLVLFRNVQLMQGPDIGLVDTGESGFHRGAFEPKRFSGIWRHQQTEANEDPPFNIYDANWKSAEDPDTVSRLIQEVIDAKFVQEFHGDIAQAKDRWPKGVAVGRLSVAKSDQRDPRRCLDSTIPNVNAKVQIKEKSFHHHQCVEDIVSARVVAHSSEAVGPTIDVSKAHKRLRIRQDECEVFLFQHCGKLYDYKVCHFGARFSAAW